MDKPPFQREHLAKALEKTLVESSEEAEENKLQAELFRGCRRIQDKIKELKSEASAEQNTVRQAQLQLHTKYYQRLYSLYIDALSDYILT